MMIKSSLISKLRELYSFARYQGRPPSPYTLALPLVKRLHILSRNRNKTTYTHGYTIGGILALDSTGAPRGRRGGEPPEGGISAPTGSAPRAPVNDFSTYSTQLNTVKLLWTSRDIGLWSPRIILLCVNCVKSLGSF